MHRLKIPAQRADHFRRGSIHRAKLRMPYIEICDKRVGRKQFHVREIIFGRRTCRGRENILRVIPVPHVFHADFHARLFRVRRQRQIYFCGVFFRRIIVARMHHAHFRTQNSAHFYRADQLRKNFFVIFFVVPDRRRKRRVRLIARQRNRIGIRAQLACVFKIIFAFDQKFRFRAVIAHRAVVRRESAFFQKR